MQSCVAVELATDCSIDAGVILGFPPERAIQFGPVSTRDDCVIWKITDSRDCARGNQVRIRPESPAVAPLPRPVVRPDRA